MNNIVEHLKNYYTSLYIEEKINRFSEFQVEENLLKVIDL